MFPGHLASPPPKNVPTRTFEGSRTFPSPGSNSSESDRCQAHGYATHLTKHMKQMWKELKTGRRTLSDMINVWCRYG